MYLDAMKTGRGAFRVCGDHRGMLVAIGGHGCEYLASPQAAADHCRHVMFLWQGENALDGSMPYFGAANALEAILETGEAE